MRCPQQVAAAIRLLEEQGFEAYAVGGCVRDSLLGLVPHDWDICTAALTEEMKTVFAGFRLIETGIAHGTLTVLLDGLPLEITTYRVDGPYSDHRRPDGVRFTSCLGDDLARRDFTVNAMAWHPERGLRDPFGGKADLENRLLRAVGEPRRRFEEDALRLMRALRFAGTYDLRIVPETAAALHEKREGLRFVAAERLRAELDRFLVTAGVDRMLTEYPDILAVFLPFIAPMVGFEQHSVYHHLDVWRHTAACVAAAIPDRDVRLALLLHDAGKPSRFTLDEEGHGHFYGHAPASASIAEETLRALKYDRKTRESIVRLVRYHDTPIPAEPPAVKRWLCRFGEEEFRLLIEIKRGDAKGHAPSVVSASLAAVDALEECLDTVIAEGACFSVRDLAVDGNDVMACGVPAGPLVGKALARLTEEVIEGRLPNERETLLEFLRGNAGTSEKP